MVDYRWSEWPEGYVFLKTGREMVPFNIPEGPERDRILQDPHRMCLMAFEYGSKLPPDLHQAMIMWSFHPEFSYCAKYYLEFVDFLDSLKRERVSFWRRGISLRSFLTWFFSRLQSRL